MGTRHDSCMVRLALTCIHSGRKLGSVRLGIFSKPSSAPQSEDMYWADRSCFSHHRPRRKKSSTKSLGSGSPRGCNFVAGTMNIFKLFLALGWVMAGTLGVLLLTKSFEPTLCVVAKPSPNAELVHGPSSTPTPVASVQHAREEQETEGRVLVVYAYWENEGEYVENLETFLTIGVQERDDVDYVFVVQGPCSVKFPKLKNVQVFMKENDCLDFGAWRYGLDKVNWSEPGRYQYFIFINSCVRGPFVPRYVPRSIHWTRLFTRMIREEGDGEPYNNGPIKLVGTTISCNGRPHVQSMIWALDLEALTFVVNNTRVLTCSIDKDYNINEGEYGLSTAILGNGWNIAAMLISYRGWDFRVNQNCNGGMDPILKGWDGWTSYFGTYPTLHETIFVKTNRGALEKDLLVYTWMEKEQAKGVWGGY